MTLAGPRVYYAMAKDGLFLPARPGCTRSSEPGGGDRRPGLWSAVLILCGTLSQLVSYTGFAVVLFSAIAVSCVFVLRRRDPDAPRPFRGGVIHGPPGSSSWPARRWSSTR